MAHVGDSRSTALSLAIMAELLCPLLVRSITKLILMCWMLLQGPGLSVTVPSWLHC